MILIPVKNLAHAKQRLAPVLGQSSRTALAQAMLLDVVETLAAWSNRPEVALVTSDPFAISLAADFNFRLLPDPSNAGETHAIERATQWAQSQGAESTLVIPADIPLLQISELEMIYKPAPPEGSVLVPSADGRGTNAVWRKPAALFPLRFGDDSFAPHQSAARDTQKETVVLSLPGIALDIDTPADFSQLANVPGNRHSQRFARQCQEFLPAATQ